MRHKYMNLFTLLTTILLVFQLGNTQEEMKKGQSDMPVFCEDFVGQLNFVEGRLIELAEAIPQEKYTWKPAEGVRSVSEVLLHAAGGNYYFVKNAGGAIPEDVNLTQDPQKWDKQTTDKSEVIGALKKSFQTAGSAAKNITHENLDETKKVFGMEMSLRNFMIATLNHSHEHLGQLIAYSRMNDITPPWTARRHQQMKKKEAQQMKKTEQY